jgi:hypothetical protein
VYESSTCSRRVAQASDIPATANRQALIPAEAGNFALMPGGACLKCGLPAEGVAKNDGNQRAAAPAKTGSFVRASGRGGSAGSKAPPLPTKKTKMQTSGGEYGGISFEALQVLPCLKLQLIVLEAGFLKSNNFSKRRVFVATAAPSCNQSPFLIQNKSS